jgi:hypothetical protein
MRRPAWVLAWAATAVLAVIWLAVFAIAPAECNLIGHCPWWSGFGVILIGAPAVGLAALVALALTLAALVRRP